MSKVYEPWINTLPHDHISANQSTLELNSSYMAMANSLDEMCLQEIIIMVVAFIKTLLQSNMMYIISYHRLTPSRNVPWLELASVVSSTQRSLQAYEKVHPLKCFLRHSHISFLFFSYFFGAFALLFPTQQVCLEYLRIPLCVS